MKLLIGTLAALALASAASAADFTGPRASVGATVDNHVGYVGTAGYDAAINKWRVGVDFNAQNLVQRNDLSLNGRLGYVVVPRVLAFVSGGSAEVSNRYGYNAGVGTELKLTERLFTTVEYRYTNIDHFSRNQGIVSLGYRF